MFLSFNTSFIFMTILILHYSCSLFHVDGLISTHNNCCLHFVQCLIFHCRPLSRRSPARPASLSWLLRATVPGAFLRPAGGSCRVENLNSSVYVYHANLQLQQSHTSVTEGAGNYVLVLPRIAHIFEENSY